MPNLEDPKRDVLLARIDSLTKDLKRITELVANEAIREYRGSLLGKFHRFTNPLIKELDDLRQDVQQGALGKDQFIELWEKYTELEEDAQRISDQCLDFLGGIAVRDMRLDGGTCELAEQLVRYYLETGHDWASVMIVGRERLFDTVAEVTQIIRVRFPEWDISSLPFTAQEFGQLVTSGTTISELRDFIEEEPERVINLLVEKPQLVANDLLAPGIASKEERLEELEQEIAEAKEKAEEKRREELQGEIAAAKEEDDEKRLENLEQEITAAKDKAVENLLAPHLRTLRQAYHGGQASDVDLDLFRQQQASHLRRLFADAFATFILGPAYLYAHLYLRVIPIDVEESLPHKPCRAHRVAFMWETLRRMNDAAKTDKYEAGPYHDVLNRVEAMWRETVELVNPGCTFDSAFGIPYDYWFSVIYSNLQVTLGHCVFTGKQWTDAKQLGDKLLDHDLPGLKPDTTLPVILNAVWHCRIQDPDRLPDIERNARELYAKAVGKPAGAQPGGLGQAAVAPQPE